MYFKKFYFRKLYFKKLINNSYIRRIHALDFAYKLCILRLLYFQIGHDYLFVILILK